MKEVTRAEEFDALRRGGNGYFIITDTSGTHIHDVRCSWVRTESFVQTAFTNSRRNAHCYWISGPDDFDDRIDVKLCSKCI